jgi:glycosyltransferase involved in cell wall biosynthesis
MKILIAACTFPPHKDGVSEAAAVMAKGFLDAGWKVDVATSPVMPDRDPTSWHGAHIHEFKIQGSGRFNHPYGGDVAEYRDFLANGDWDVVIFHAYVWSILVPVDMLDRIKAKKILVSHGYNALQWIRSPKFPWGLWVWAYSVMQAIKMAFWLRRIDRAVYLSNRADLRGFFDHWIAKSTRYQGRRVIPNGINPDERGTNPESFRLEHGIDSEQTMFLCVANYSRRKDQGFAARSFRAARMPNAVLVFIGSEFNHDYARFKAEDDSLTDSAKIGRIIWLEGQSREKTLNAFAACDAFVLSADHEAQPIALLEAMRESKPWIARESGCISEMPGGIFIKTEAEMTAEMQQLTADKDLRETLGEAGRNAIETVYKREKYEESYLRLVQDLC